MKTAPMSIVDELRAGVATASAEETRGLAARLAAVLPPDTTLALHGDLGVGKTTFVQGLAQGLGLRAQVTSPTFNILHIYRSAAAPHFPGEISAGLHPQDEGSPQIPQTGAPNPTLVHLDAYRLENAHQIDALMLDDFLVSPYCLAVEWPERIAAWLPVDAWHLTLAIESPGHHRIHLRSDGTDNST
jgi:tRNA threonylcarbamoyladenosine biosynthesis protein TsaE